MAYIKVNTNVVFERDEFGRFIKECEDAAHRTVEDTVKLGVRTAKALAPVGGERKSNYSQRAGYRPLRSSIEGKAMGNRGEWTVSAPHWKYVEFSTGAHPITGFLGFPWEGSPEGQFVWHDYRFSNWNEAEGATIHHPGTHEQPFMRPSYERAARRQMMAIAKRNYPG